jgi:hypothetical protein
MVRWEGRRGEKKRKSIRRIKEMCRHLQRIWNLPSS